jgi:hypothetical protein
MLASMRKHRLFSPVVLAVVLAAPSQAWELKLVGAPVESGGVPSEPYLSLDLNCGARLILPSKLPEPAAIAKDDLNYRFYFEKVRDNAAYRARVKGLIDPKFVFTLTPAQEDSAFGNAKLSFQNSKELAAERQKLDAKVSSLSDASANRSEVRKALKDLPNPDGIKGLRRTLIRLLADKNLKSSDGGDASGPVTLTDVRQQKLLLQQALASTFIWDVSSAGERAQKGADAERRTRLRDIGRFVNIALPVTMENEFLISHAFKSSLFRLPDEGPACETPRAP